MAKCNQLIPLCFKGLSCLCVFRYQTGISQYWSFKLSWTRWNSSIL